MSDLNGWKPGNVSRPSSQKSVSSTPTKARRKSDSAASRSHTPIRRNPGRLARPANYLDDTSRSHKSNGDRLWSDVVSSDRV